MNQAYLIAGLAYGDEGKGSVTDALVRTTGAKLVVRYNGGPQAAHNVVTDEGQHHTFSQFGSGSFIPGVKSYLSRFMLIEPFALLNEHEVLSATTGRSHLKDVYIEEGCVVITPFHWIANRIRETRRGKDRHGSCGFGVGEARGDQLDGQVTVTAGDLKHWDFDQMYSKLLQLRALKQSQIGDAPQLAAESIYSLMYTYENFAKKVNIVPNGTLTGMLDGPVIFEGAQGMLLDETYGKAPHNTWTDITFKNALRLLEGTDYEPIKIGVVRTYFTRHGAGPFATEAHHLSFEDHNKTGDWQGHFRFGYFDLDAVKYSISCIGGIDGIALTHLDQTNGSILRTVNPELSVLEEELDVPFWIRSYGALSGEKVVDIPVVQGAMR